MSLWAVQTFAPSTRLKDTGAAVELWHPNQSVICWTIKRLWFPRIQLLGIMNVCTTFHVNPANSSFFLTCFRVDESWRQTITVLPITTEIISHDWEFVTIGSHSETHWSVGGYICLSPPDPEASVKTNALHAPSLSVSLIDSQLLSRVSLV